MVPNKFSTVAVLIGLTFTAMPVQALIYCCNDDAGKRVCGNPLPSLCYGRAYLKRDGGRTEHFEAPMSAEQKAQRQAELERKKEEARLAAEERRRNQALLATYPSEADIERARERAVADAEKHLKHARERLETAEKRKDELDKEAEFYQKSPMPPDLAKKLRDHEKEIQAARENVAARRKDIDGIRLRFEDEKERFRRALGVGSALPAAGGQSPAPSATSTARPPAAR